MVSQLFKKMIDELQYIRDDLWVNYSLLNNLWSNAC
jgi:hypothetical protein